MCMQCCLRYSLTFPLTLVESVVISLSFLILVICILLSLYIFLFLFFSPLSSLCPHLTLSPHQNSVCLSLFLAIVSESLSIYWSFQILIFIFLCVCILNFIYSYSHLYCFLCPCFAFKFSDCFSGLWSWKA